MSHLGAQRQASREIRLTESTKFAGKQGVRKFSTRPSTVMGPDADAASVPGPIKRPIAQSEIIHAAPLGYPEGNMTPSLMGNRTPSTIGSRTPMMPAEVVRPVQIGITRSTSPMGARTPIYLQAETQPAEMQPIEVVCPQSLKVGRPQPAEVVRPVQTQGIRPVEVRGEGEPMTQTHQAAPTGDLDVVYSDAFVTKDEFQTTLAASLQLILQGQVAKLQETMTLEVNKLNVRIEEIANAQEADIGVRMDQISTHVEKYASLQEVTSSSIHIMSAEVKDLKDKLANLQQANARMDQTEARVEKNVNDIRKLESILQQFNERTDQMSTQIEKIANDFETSFHQTEARVEKNVKDILELDLILQQLNVRTDMMIAQMQKNANNFETSFNRTEERVEKSANNILKLSASLESMAGQQEKSMGDIREIEGAMELIMSQRDQTNPQPNGASLRQTRKIVNGTVQTSDGATGSLGKAVKELEARWARQQGQSCS